MTEYTRIDLSKYENRDKTEWAVESMLECTLLCWLDDAQEHIRKLEARIEKMQAAGDVLVQIAGIIGLCWSTTSFPAMGHIQEAIDNWRNA